MAINSSPFINVAAGVAIAASDLYLYAVDAAGLGPHPFMRSSDGVDWEPEPGIDITFGYEVGTLIEGTSYLLLTGDSTYRLPKNSSTWTRVNDLGGTTRGGRYIGGRYFVFDGDVIWVSVDTLGWFPYTMPQTVQDITFDGVNYVILTTNRCYRTTNFGQFFAFPTPFYGISIAYYNNAYWISASNYIIRSVDLVDFDFIFPVVSVTSRLSVVDNTLIFGNGVINGNSGYYYLEDTFGDYVQTKISDTGYGDILIRSTLVMQHQLIVHNGYVYLSGGTIQRAVYNPSWRNPVNAPVLTLNQLSSGVVDTSYSSGLLGTIIGGREPYTWSGSVTNPANQQVAVISSSSFVFTPVVLGTFSYAVTVTDYYDLSDEKTGTFFVTDGNNTTELLFVANTLPNAQENVAYSASVGGVSGGTPPYSWNIDSKSWGEAAAISNIGVFSTTFISAGNETLTVSVTDSGNPTQSKSAVLGITVTENTNTGIISGTLRLDTSTGEFAARKVYLYNYITGAKIDETTSDAITGTWQFTQVAAGSYFVVGVAESDDLNIPRDFDALGVITIS